MHTCPARAVHSGGLHHAPSEQALSPGAQGVPPHHLSPSHNATHTAEAGKAGAYPTARPAVLHAFSNPAFSSPSGGKGGADMEMTHLRNVSLSGPLSPSSPIQHNLLQVRSLLLVPLCTLLVHHPCAPSLCTLKKWVHPPSPLMHPPCAHPS